MFARAAAVRPLLLVPALAIAALCAALPAHAQADLAVTKSGPATVSAGNDITYAIGVANNGPGIASTVTLVDPLPAGTTFVSAVQNTGPAFTCSTPAVGGTGNVTCSNGALATGAAATFTLVFKVGVGVADGTTIANTATVSAATADPNPGNNSATSVTTGINNADLAVTKTGPATVNAGSNITYTLGVTNAGPGDAQTVTLTDPLVPATPFVSFTAPAGWTCSTPAVGGTGTVSCTIATLAAGASATFTLVNNVPTGVANGTLLSNTATISSATTDPSLANNSATSTVSVLNLADLGVTKSSPGTITAGSNVTYTLDVTNAGPTDAQSVMLADPLPGNINFVSLTSPAGWTCTTPAVGTTGTVTCTIATLAAGASASFTLVATVPAGMANGTAITNTAVVSSATTDPNPGNSTATSTGIVGTAADLAVTKTGPATIVAGSNITYTLHVTNGGPSDSQPATLVDVLPAGTTFVSVASGGWTCTTPAVGGTGTVTCTNPGLPNGASEFLTLVYNVSAAVASGTVITNTAVVSSPTTDPVPGNNSGSSSVTVANGADLAVTKSGPGTITAGSNISYTLAITNNGPLGATNVALTDALPAGTTFVSAAQNSGPAFTLSTPAVGGTGTVTCTTVTLASGASATFTLVVNVAGNAANGTTITNTATATSSTTDAVPGNNSQSSSATVNNSADLAVTKSGTATVAAGNDITYTLGLTNNGPVSAQNVSLSDALPAGTTFVSAAQNSGPAFTLTTPAVGGTGTVTNTIATLASGASATFTLVVKVAAGVASGTTITNTASVSASTVDPTPANNAATATTTTSAVTTFSGPSATGSGTVTVSFVGGGAGCSFSAPQLIGAPPGSPPVPPTTPGPGILFPHGMFTFTTIGCTPGSTLTFTVTYPSAITGASYWKYGPTAADSTAHWYVLPATISGSTATFSITDGGLGDDDLLANGAIVDQGGPGLGPPPVTAIQTPTLSEWMLLVLALAMMGLGMRGVLESTARPGSRRSNR